MPIDIVPYIRLAMKYSAGQARRERAKRTDSEAFSVACLALVTARDGYEPDRGVAFSTYASHSIFNALKKARLREQTAKRTPEKPIVRETSGDFALDELVRDDNFPVRLEIAEEVERYLSLLKSREKRYVVAYFIEEKTYKEIGATEGICEEAVRQIVKRSIDHLRGVAARERNAGSCECTGLSTVGNPSTSRTPAESALSG